MTLPVSSNPASRTPLVIEPAPLLSDGPERMTFAHLFMLVRRRLGIVVLVIAIALLLALLLTAAAPKTYRAESDVVFEPRTTDIVPGASDGGSAPPPPMRTEEIETQIALITSREMAGTVFDSLKLSSDESFRAQVLDPPSAIGNVLQSIGIRRHASSQAMAMADDRFREKAIGYLLGHLQVNRIASSFSLQILVSDADRDRAAQVANAFAKLYSSDDVRQHSARNRMAAKVLEPRLDELRTQANADFAAVQAYRINHGLLSQSATGLTEQEISVYNQQIAEARATASRDASLLASAQAQLNRGGTAAVGAAGSSPVIASLRSQRAELASKEADLSSRFLDSYPDLVTVRQQIAALDRQINNEVDRVVHELAAQAKASAQRLASLQSSQSSARSQLSGDNGALVTLDDLQRKADASKALYQSYLERYNAVIAGSGAEQPNVRIVSLAAPPVLPISPKPLLNLVFGLLVGTLLGISTALVAELSYNGLTTADDVEQRLHVRSLGFVPKLDSLEQRAESPLATVAEYPDGAFAESLRGLISSINQTRSGRGKVIAVTSAIPGEGKTTISSCLALALAISHERVAILDCDIMRANLSGLWSSKSTELGLREMLQAGGEPVFETQPGEPTVIPIRMPFAKGERLNESDRFRNFVARLASRFDIVILDCAPILPIAEMREIVRYADSVVMVTRWRRTSDKTVRSAIRQLPMQVLADVGVVLNAMDMKKRSHFGGSDAAAFYRSYKNYYA